MQMQDESGADKQNVDSRDADFGDLQLCIKLHFEKQTGSLFKTDAKSLCDIYISNLPESERQAHTCGMCKNFLSRYGDLVAIDESGKLHSALWAGSGMPHFYEATISALKVAVESATVTGVFLAKQQALGTNMTPTPTRDWTHFSVALSENSILKNPVQSPFQAMAEKREDHKNMTKALDELAEQSIITAVQILKSNALYRNEKVLGAAEWLKNDPRQVHFSKKQVGARKYSLA